MTVKKLTTVSNVKVKYLTIAGIMAALITLMTAYVCHIPIGVNGGYIHFGDSLIYLTAALLPTPYALAAAAIGGGLADLMTAPMWAPATIIIKMLLAILFTNKSNKIITRYNMLVTIPACVITIGGYYLAEYLIFGVWPIPLSMLQNLIQSVGSAIFFLLFGLALDKAHLKVRFFEEN
uniref:TIGR04002 family protein n=1 Tax=Acetatifactor sp. TaxID=1872090 RepID=UPI004055C4C2